MPLVDLRREYKLAALSESEVASEPFTQFAKWFQQAQTSGLLEPNAMTLATADRQGVPSARVVLLKGVDEQGFVFYTNYGSRKGRELAENSSAALLFYWGELERQVRLEGTVAKTPQAESELYFGSRPRSSQLGAWVSAQSTVITGRNELDAHLEKLNAQFAGRAIPLPPFWGGYRLSPTVVEFWQGRPSRLHDRLRYRLDADGSWTIDRLAP